VFLTLIEKLLDLKSLAANSKNNYEYILFIDPLDEDSLLSLIWKI